ncbi:MAG: hypothetical protein A4E64_02142 [Syntrophorhabdus sp. PtaU1.Bin058]|nr:MAG: hypothetical protein A4E64_02142 [Syntrophorhabdus sp. PtaU1.Bin058]
MKKRFNSTVTIIAVLIAVVLAGCASMSALNQAVTGYEVTGAVIKNADAAFQELKTKGIVSEDQAVKYEELYQKAKKGYILAGDTLKLVINAKDDVEQKNYLKLYLENADAAFKLATDLTDFIQEVKK